MFRTFVGFAALLMVSQATATFPIELLDCSYFDYSSGDFLGHNFGFGSEVKFTQSGPDGFPVESTGLNGFAATPQQVSQVSGITSGVPIPLGRQTLNNLFPTGSPEQALDGWSENLIWGSGDLATGFTEVAIQQKKVVEVGQDGAEPSDFADVAAVTKGYAAFGAVGGNGTVPAELTIDFDSLFDFEAGGFVSEGVKVQLLDVTDPESAQLLYEVSGFYFADENSLSAEFRMGETDLTDSFNALPGIDGAPHEASFSYSMMTGLDPAVTYGLIVDTDVSAGTSGDGSSGVDSGNTVEVSVRLLDPATRLVLPGATTVPEPTALALLVGSAMSMTARPARNGWKSPHAAVTNDR